jgi:hypothetical protein
MNIITTNSPDFFLNIKESFVYNFYSNKETLTIDNIIVNNINNPYKFIRLVASARTKYDKRIFSFYDSIRLEALDEMSNRNLDKNDLIYFNHIHMLEPNTKNLNYDLNDAEIKKINNFYEINELEFQDAIRFTKSNKKVSISNSYTDEFKKSNKSNVFFTGKNLSDIVDYEEIILDVNKDVNITQDISKLIINSGFKPLHKKSVYNRSSKIESYYLKIGFLIEKYVKKEGKFKKLCSYFKYNTQNSDISRLDRSNISHTIDYSFTLNDAAIKYGDIYKYAVYPVYITSIPANLDYHMYNEYIVCGYPYITKSITCKEYKRPIPPSQISFKYATLKKSLKIYWSKPLEEQGDVKGYQIFKRHNLEDPFVLIKQLEFHNKNDLYERNNNVSSEIIEELINKNLTEYYDKNFKLEKISIYCICSIDAHGFISNYSPQYAVRYNHHSKKCELDLVSSSGAPLHMPNLLIPRKTKFFNNDDYLVTNTPVEEKVKKFTIYATPEYNRINFNASVHKSMLHDSYKLSLFKIENSSVYVDDISILNFNNENFI